MSKKQGYKSTNATTKFQAACVAEIRENRATTNKENKITATAFTGAIAKKQAAIKSLREILASIKNKMETWEPRTPPRQRRRKEVETPPRQPRRHYKLESDMKPESPPNRTQEAYKQKQKKKRVNQKSRNVAAKKAATVPTARATEISGDKFERGGEYKPVMKFRKDMDQKIKWEFLRLRETYHVTGTEVAKADRVKSIK